MPKFQSFTQLLRRLSQRPWRYLMPPLFVGATTWALLFWHVDNAIIDLAYLLPVLISTVLTGWGGGLLASLLSFLAYNYFFISPQYTLFVTDLSDLLALVVFIVVATLTSRLLGAWQAEAQRVRQREQEWISLYELSKAVSGQIGLEPMLRTIAEQVCQSFPQSHCEIWLKSDVGQLTLAAAVGEPPAAQWQLHEMLIRSGQATRDTHGVLKVFVPPAQIFADNQRLRLDAMATQAALAVERTQLTQTATRAKVLEESDKLKSALLSSVSHDLRTPLATIKAAVTSLLQRDIQWDEAALVDQLDAINEETDRLNHVIGNLLSMSRIEAGAVSLQKREYALQEVLGAVLQRLAPLTAQHIVKTDLPPDLPPVLLDYAAFEQIITNLMDNAVKYAPTGSDILITARRVGPLLEVSVTDHGQGIPKELQNVVFDKFYRTSPETAPAPHGTGLGLSIVKGFVEAHGGHVWLVSQIGTGTSVKFTLPLSASAE